MDSEPRVTRPVIVLEIKLIQRTMALETSLVVQIVCNLCANCGAALSCCQSSTLPISDIRIANMICWPFKFALERSHATFRSGLTRGSGLILLRYDKP